MKNRESTLAELRELHQRIDQRAQRLETIHADRLHCKRGCDSCCIDNLTVFPVEAERIRHSHPALLEHGDPYPAGACAFLGEAGDCRIYADRPYVCRTQGLPLRWFAEGEAADGVGREVCERRDICPLNTEGSPLETLSDEACWLIGPVEDELGELQHQFDGQREERIYLRALFNRR
jgi:Fe-S-cluster containining protein